MVAEPADGGFGVAYAVFGEGVGLLGGFAVDVIAEGTGELVIDGDGDEAALGEVDGLG